MQRELPGPLLICIEGNVGCGKSTVMRALRKLLSKAKGVRLVDEPVDEWTENGFLAAMYDETLNSAAFQLMVLASLAGDMLAAMAGEPAIIITERSAWSNYNVFAKATLSGMELSAARFAFKRVVSTLPASLKRVVIFLDAPPAVAKRRADTRARYGEDGIQIEYFNRLDTLHRQWLEHEEDVVRVDATADEASVLKAVCEAVSAHALKAATLYTAERNSKPQLTRQERLAALYGNVKELCASLNTKESCAR